MVLEVPVGLALAVMGLLGCALLLFETRLRTRPVPWLGFFLGVLLFLVLHDLTDAFSLEPTLRITLRFTLGPALAPVISFGMVVLGTALGAVLATALLDRPHGERGAWYPLLLLLGLLLAIHAAVDGTVVGATLRASSVGDVLEARAIGLQALHRALEGGVLVAFLLYAGVARRRVVALALYVGLPFAVTTPAVLVSPFETFAAFALLLSFLEASAFLVLLLRGLWPVLAEKFTGRTLLPWLLAGLLVTFVAHALAH